MKRKIRKIILFLRIFGDLNQNEGYLSFWEYLYKGRLGVETSWFLAEFILLDKEDLSKPNIKNHEHTN